jgi:hypothetical protein
MNDIFCLQISSFSDPGFPGGTPNAVFGRHLFTCSQQSRSGCGVNRTIHPSAAKHPGIGRVDNGINPGLGDIPLANVYHVHLFLFHIHPSVLQDACGSEQITAKPCRSRKKEHLILIHHFVRSGQIPFSRRIFKPRDFYSEFFNRCQEHTVLFFSEEVSIEHAKEV